MAIELGDRVRDKVSGFTGIVTTLTKCLTGCDRCGVNPPMKADGTLGDSWSFDLDQCEIIEKKAVDIPATARLTGGPPTRA